MRFRFPKSHRLLTKREFATAFEARRSVRDNRFVAHYCPNGLPFGRLGLAVSRKVGRAVVRNRVKRLVREAFRLNQDAFAGWDLVIVPNGRSDDLTIESVTESLLGLVARFRLPKRRQRDSASTADDVGLPLKESSQ